VAEGLLLREPVQEQVALATRRAGQRRRPTTRRSRPSHAAAAME
jgi:hypothetical protein